jgi:tellurite resistance protein
MSFRPSEEEEKYFQAVNADKRAAIRLRLDDAASELSERGTIGQTLGTNDEELVEKIRALGFDADTARVFDLLPLVHVAWADGKISAKERSKILELVSHRGITPDDEAWILIEALLERQPSQKFLDETLSVLKSLAGDRSGKSASVVDLCLDIANASGGLLGLTSAVSAAERELLGHIAGALGEDAQAHLSSKLAR